MEKDDIADALGKWVKTTRAAFKGDKSDWARAYRRAAQEIDDLIPYIRSGDLGKLRELSEMK